MGFKQFLKLKNKNIMTKNKIAILRKIAVSPIRIGDVVGFNFTPVEGSNGLHRFESLKGFGFCFCANGDRFKHAKCVFE